MKILDDDVISASRECFCSCSQEEKELFIIQFGFMHQKTVVDVKGVRPAPYALSAGDLEHVW